MLRIIGELFGFLFARKKYWLLPVFVLLGLVGGIVIMSKGSAVAPFVYAIF
jgi:hypothetical protein